MTEGDAVADAGPAIGPDRRRVMMLGAATGLGVAGVAGLAGCGSGSASTTTGADSSAGASATAAAAATPTGPLATLSDIPVGGSYASAGVNGQPMVISQPEAGKVVAFSASCTHAGCKVTPEGKKLTCPCHNSTFDAFTGQVLSGPATAPLPPVDVKLNGTDVVLG
jgi:Rieske Fe-S protein